jgi:hypothetical protein
MTSTRFARRANVQCPHDTSNLFLWLLLFSEQHSFSSVRVVAIDEPSSSVQGKDNSVLMAAIRSIRPAGCQLKSPSHGLWMVVSCIPIETLHQMQLPSIDEAAEAQTTSMDSRRRTTMNQMHSLDTTCLVTQQKQRRKGRQDAGG